MESYIELIDSRAVMPHRHSRGDVGYDLTLVSRKEVDADIWGSNIQVYGTGIKLLPATAGFYWEVVPRSSMAKTPYIMPHSVGIIDREYTGEILVVLRKIDLERDDLTLPIRLCQLVARNYLEVNFVEKTIYIPSFRGSGGFGSSS